MRILGWNQLDIPSGSQFAVELYNSGVPYDSFGAVLDEYDGLDGNSAGSIDEVDTVAVKLGSINIDILVTLSCNWLQGVF